MSDKEKRQPVGSLKISEDVIATIASVAALEIEGVDSLSQSTQQVGRIFASLGKKPIHVDVNDDFVTIDISLSLKFGAKIEEVCTAVQNAIKDSVQTMSGMAVSKVNVLVSGIVFPPRAE